MAKYRVETDKGTYEIETEEAPAPKQPSSGSMAVDAIRGVGAGVISTGVGAYDLARKIPGIGDVLPEPSSSVRQATQAPDSFAGKAGKFVEQAAEFIIPGMAAAKLTKGAPLLTRMAAEGVAAGGTAAVQTGGDPSATATTAMLGGAAPGVGAAIASKAAPIAKFLEESALKQYGRVINATTKGNKFLSQNEVAPGLLKMRVKAFTMKGLKSKATQQVAEIGRNIDDAFANLPAGTSVDAKAVVQQLESNAIKDLTLPDPSGALVEMGPYAEQAAANAKRLAETILKIADTDPATGAVTVPVDKIRSLRQYFDKVAAKAGRYEGKELADQSMAEAHGMAADAIRGELAKQFPDIAKLNKEFHFWKDAEKVIGDTVLRREGQAKPLGRKLLSAGTAAAGMVDNGITGMVLGKIAGDQFEALITSPAWGTVSAVMKDKLAKSIATGNKLNAQSTVRSMLRSVGMETTKRAFSREAPSGQLQPAPAR